MPDDKVTMDKIVALSKRRGFIFQSSEIYGGLASTYDYGHYGVLLKGNVKAEWQAGKFPRREQIGALDARKPVRPKEWADPGHLPGLRAPPGPCPGDGH